MEAYGPIVITQRNLEPLRKLEGHDALLALLLSNSMHSSQGPQSKCDQ